MIIIDEAAHIHQDLFWKVIAPILQLTNTALMCLSSPEGTGNYYSQLLNMKDGDGNPMFKRVNCYRICDACQKLDPEEQIKCDHVPQTAHWLSEGKTKRLKGLYSNSSALALREYGGIIISDHTPVYKKDEIADTFNRDRYITSTIPNYIFTAVDPSGGGPSHMAICSGYYNKNGDFIVSIINHISQYSCVTALRKPVSIAMILYCE